MGPRDLPSVATRPNPRAVCSDLEAGGAVSIKTQPQANFLRPRARTPARELRQARSSPESRCVGSEQQRAIAEQAGANLVRTVIKHTFTMAPRRSVAYLRPASPGQEAGLVPELSPPRPHRRGFLLYSARDKILGGGETSIQASLQRSENIRPNTLNLKGASELCHCRAATFEGFHMNALTTAAILIVGFVPLALAQPSDQRSKAVSGQASNPSPAERQRCAQQSHKILNKTARSACTPKRAK
jgi:hypothetical protein